MRKDKQFYHQAKLFFSNRAGTSEMGAYTREALEKLKKFFVQKLALTWTFLSKFDANLQNQSERFPG